MSPGHISNGSVERPEAFNNTAGFFAERGFKKSIKRTASQDKNLEQVSSPLARDMKEHLTTEVNGSGGGAIGRASKTSWQKTRERSVPNANRLLGMHENREIHVQD